MNSQTPDSSFIPPFLKTDKMKSVDWSATPLGVVSGWRASLRASAGVCLHSLLPSMLCWGSDMTAIYNDAFQEAFVPALSASMGRPLRLVFPKMWSDYGATLQEEVLEKGHPARVEIRSPAWLKDPAKTSPYMGLAFTPVFDETGVVGGVFITAWPLAHPLALSKKPDDVDGVFQSYFDSIQTPMVVVDLDYYFVQINAAFKRLTGYRLTDLRYKNLSDIVHPDDLADGLKLLRQLETGEIASFQIEKRYYKKDRSIVWVKNNVTMLRDASGFPMQIIIMAEDVGKTRETEKALQASDLQFKQALDFIPQMAWTAQPDGRLDYFNRRWFEYTGMESSLDDLVWTPLLHPDDRARSAAAWRQSLESGTPYQMECRIADRHSPGVYRWFIVRATPLRDAGGQIVKWFGACTDVHEMKMIEQTLRDSEERFRRLAEEAPILVWTSAAAGGVQYINKRFTDFIGFDGSETLNAYFSKGVIHADDFAHTADVFKTAFLTQSAYTLEARLKENATGQYQWFLFKSVPKWENGRFDGFIGMGVDIHSQKTTTLDLEARIVERTAALQDANQRLQKSNTELEQFAYTASHDLQEPLRKIRTFAGLLNDRGEQLNERDRLYIQKISESAFRMSNLIADVLQFSRLSQSRQIYEQVDLKLVVDHILEDLEVVLLQKEATIERSLLPTLEAIPLQMGQLFYNLVSNGLKFSKPDVAPVIHIGSEKLTRRASARIAELSPNLDYYRITVTDNGIGFEEEFSERIFQMFQRLHERSAYSGSGIGLALCRKIADNHQGIISAHSEVGQGSVFNIYLPEKQ